MPLGACGMTPPGGAFAGSSITFSRKHRSEAREGIAFSRKHRSSNSAIVFSRKHRSTATNTITFSRKHRSAALSSTYLDAVQTGDDPGDYDLRVYAYKDGTTREIERAYLLTLEMEESKSTKWTLDIWDEDGLYNPENSGSIWYQWLERHPHNGSDIAYARKMIAVMTYGGMTFTFVGVPDHRGYTWSDDDGAIYTRWSGVDMSKVLFRPGQNAATIRSTRSSQQWSKTVAATLLETYGLKHDLSGLENYVIPVQHRQNNMPIAWLAGGPISVLGVPVAEWTMDGGEIFKVYRPVAKPKEQADFTYDYSNGACGVTVNVDAGETGNAFNVVRGARARESGSVQATSTPTSWGQYTVTFDVPLSNVAWTVITNVLGIFSNFEGYNAAGTLVAAAGARQGTYPSDVANAAWLNIKSVKYSWGEPIPGMVDDTNAHGKIVFTGTPPDNPDTFGSLHDGDYTYEKDLSSAGPGSLPFELAPNPMIPSYTWLVLHVDRTAEKMSTDGVARGAKVRYNPMLCPGMTVREKGGRINADRAVYCRKVKHSITMDWDRRYTEYQGVEYD